MRTGLIIVAAALAASTASAASMASLEYENILLPLPQGFKAGWSNDQPGMHMVEYVPAGETVNDWSRMVTEQVFLHQGGQDPNALPLKVAASWATACPGGTGLKVTQAVENGYPIALWQFLCPRNPRTGKPENMWMKAISGSDALYSVQYAWRAPASQALVAPTMTYLHQVMVCDTRKSDHPCPKGM